MEKFIKMNEFKIQGSCYWEDHFVENRMKNSHLFKSYVHLFNTQTIFQAWVIFHFGR